MSKNFKLLVLACASLAALSGQGQAFAADAAPALASYTAGATGAATATAYEGVVEAVRQSVLASQVAAAVLAVPVQAGDKVKAGQLLLRLDARAAEQHADAAAAQVQAARAAQAVATRDYERQQQLFEKKYISEAAMDRAQAQYQAAQAQASAQLAQAGAARTESGFYVLRAPYDGVVAEVSVVVGDMALPGRPLLTVYDPGALRVSAAVPESVAIASQAPLAELPGIAPQRLVPRHWQRLPAVDPATHTMLLRLDLPAGTAAVPGMFARVWLPGAAGDASVISVPRKAVLQRGELTAVYVLGTGDRPLLRQIRLGHARGDQIEVLSGLRPGERVALDPQAAAKVQ